MAKFSSCILAEMPLATKASYHCACRDVSGIQSTAWKISEPPGQDYPSVTVRNDTRIVRNGSPAPTIERESS